MFLSVGSNPVEADGTSQRDVGGFFYSAGFRLGSLHKIQKKRERKKPPAIRAARSASARLQALHAQEGILLT